jgi:hypothetical protein
MTDTNLITVNRTNVPIFAAAILLVIAGLGIFAVGFDQGHIFSIAFGQEAFDSLYLHELTHDMRHAAGFPCH